MFKVADKLAVENVFVPDVFHIYDWWNVTNDELEEVCRDLNMDASPGLPLACHFSDKAACLGAAKSLIFDVVRERLRLLLSTTVDDTSGDALDYVEAGLCDPVRLFVKREPHTHVKAVERRWRLISSVSIVDEIIDRLIFGWSSRIEIANYDKLPYKPGISFNEEGATKLGKRLVSLTKGGKLVATDVSGWDWGVKGAQMDGYARYEQLRFLAIARHFGLSEIIIREQLTLIWNRVRVMQLKIFVASDGTAVMQEIPGVVPSGDYKTSKMNSYMRVAAGVAAGAAFVEAMGDDALEDLGENLEGRQENYLKLGIRIKDFRVYSCEQFCFCSHQYASVDDVYACWPINWEKMLFRLFQYDFDPDSPNTHEIWQSYVSELKSHPRQEYILKLAQKFWALNLKPIKEGDGN